MPVRYLLSYSCFLLVFLIASSCQEQELNATGEIYLELPSTRYQYNNFSDTTNAITTLGRVLFYDRQLSINNTISCASCHKQSAGFADNQQFSRGFEGRFTTRNSMPIQNLGIFMFAFDAGTLSSFRPINSDFFSSSSSSSFFGGGQHLFWDGRESILGELVLQPVGNHIEMGITDVDALADKLSALPYYQPLFNDAFQDTEITSDKMSTALTAFVSSIRTQNTRFDQHNMRLEGKASVLNALELEGMALFTEKYDCNSCHQVMSPIGYVFAGTFANVGLDAVYADNGLQNTTGNSSDAGKFKIPSLRNVAYTAPYMHDGRFKTLDEVMGHYSDGMADHPNLDARLKGENGRAKSMNISQHEKQALIAFLQSLSDESVLRDPKFSNPFKTR